jgi:RNA polymerase sigma factor (sigma-70 family)
MTGRTGTAPPGADEQSDALLRAVRARPPLSPGEQTRLARQVRRGDDIARRRMIEGNLRLVFAVAGRYRGRGAPLADLVQDGTIGLARAVERFDPDRGATFPTYAVWWIRRSMLDAIAASRPIRVPPAAARKLAAVRRAEAELRRAGIRPVTAEAIAGRTGLSAATVRSLREAPLVSASLDDPVGEDGAALRDLVADDNAADPVERAIADDERRAVSKLLALLPARHREVLSRRYGVDREAAESHDEIGARLGIGEERSRQIEREALHRLRSVTSHPARRAA